MISAFLFFLLAVMGYLLPSSLNGVNSIVMSLLIAMSLQASWLRAMVVSLIHSVISLIIAGTIIGTFSFVAFYA